ncbi:MAG: hypothetical protein ACYC61_04740 [Isosphaeraceae bacterium]
MAGESTPAAGGVQPSVARRWQRPAPGWGVAVLAAVTCTLPAWILADELRAFTLRLDDFAYVSRSRDWPTTTRYLLVPHNTHVVPIFRLWTFGLVSWAGRLEALPAVLAWASYLALIAPVAAVGWLVAWETGQRDSALGAMALLGLSSVCYPIVTWYSAGQALWAGAAVVVTVSLARAWAVKGGVLRFVAIVAGAIAAAAVWSGGLAAGPAAIAYLFARKTPRARRAALLLAGITAVAAVGVVVFSRGHLLENANFWERHEGLLPRPVQAVLHTGQAMVEVGLFGNLGVDATTTPGQAVGLLVLLAALHAWSRGGPGRLNPLEAAGFTMAVVCYLLEFALRGNLAYSQLRLLSWYNAVPQVGIVLFAAGWWSAVRPGGSGSRRLTRGQAVGVLGFIVVVFAVHHSRAQAQIIAEAPPFRPNEAGAFPTAELRLGRALYYKEEYRRRQVRALARLDRLDRLDRILARANASPETLRAIAGRVVIPGIDENQLNVDALSLLVGRPRDPKALDALGSRRAEIEELLSPEPEAVPFWLDPNDPLSGAVRRIQKELPPSFPQEPRKTANPAAHP